MSWEKIDKKFVFFYRKHILGYAKYGLVHDDIFNSENAIVIEAINRLPLEVRNARDKRLSLAFDLSLHKTCLPSDQWTPVEIDVPYLSPYVAWVEAEMEEIDAEYMSRYDIPVAPLQRYDLEDYHGRSPVFDKRKIE